MTDEQIKQQIAQAEQDAITLDYTKWSAQRIQAKLPNDHNLWQFERDRTLARQKWDNAAARRKHLEGLETARNAKKAEADAQTELELQPEKGGCKMNGWQTIRRRQPPTLKKKRGIFSKRI